MNCCQTCLPRRGRGNRGCKKRGGFYVGLFQIIFFGIIAVMCAKDLATVDENLVHTPRIYANAVMLSFSAATTIAAFILLLGVQKRKRFLLLPMCVCILCCIIGDSAVWLYIAIENITNGGRNYYFLTTVEMFFDFRTLKQPIFTLVMIADLVTLAINTFCLFYVVRLYEVIEDRVFNWNEIPLQLDEISGSSLKSVQITPEGSVDMLVTGIPPSHIDLEPSQTDNFQSVPTHFLSVTHPTSITLLKCPIDNNLTQSTVGNSEATGKQKNRRNSVPFESKGNYEEISEGEVSDRIRSPGTYQPINLQREDKFRTLKQYPHISSSNPSFLNVVGKETERGTPRASRSSTNIRLLATQLADSIRKKIYSPTSRKMRSENAIYEPSISRYNQLCDNCKRVIKLNLNLDKMFQSNTSIDTSVERNHYETIKDDSLDIEISGYLLPSSKDSSSKTLLCTCPFHDENMPIPTPPGNSTSTLEELTNAELIEFSNEVSIAGRRPLPAIPSPASSFSEGDRPPNPATPKAEINRPNNFNSLTRKPQKDTIDWNPIHGEGYRPQNITASHPARPSTENTFKDTEQDSVISIQPVQEVSSQSDSYINNRKFDSLEDFSICELNLTLLAYIINSSIQFEVHEVNNSPVNSPSPLTPQNPSQESHQLSPSHRVAWTTIPEEDDEYITIVIPVTPREADVPLVAYCGTSEIQRRRQVRLLEENGKRESYGSDNGKSFWSNEEEEEEVKAMVNIGEGTCETSLSEGRQTRTYKEKACSQTKGNNEFEEEDILYEVTFRERQPPSTSSCLPSTSTGKSKPWFIEKYVECKTEDVSQPEVKPQKKKKDKKGPKNKKRDGKK